MGPPTEDAERKPYPDSWEQVAEVRVFRGRPNDWDKLAEWRAEMTRQGWQLLRVTSAHELVAVFGRSRIPAPVEHRL